MTTIQVYGLSAVTRRVWARLTQVTSDTKGSASTETVMALLLVGVTGMAGMTTLGGGMGDAISTHGGVAAPTSVSQARAGGMAVSSQAGMDLARAAKLADAAGAARGGARAAGEVAGTVERVGTAAESVARAGSHAPWADVAPHPRIAAEYNPTAVTKPSRGTRTEAMNGILEGLWADDVNVTAGDFAASTRGNTVEEARAFWESRGAKVFVAERKKGTRLQEALALASDANWQAKRFVLPSVRVNGAGLRTAQRVGSFTESLSVVAGNGVSRAVAAFKAAFLHGSQSVGARAGSASASPRSVAESIAAGFAQDLGITAPQTFVSRSGTPLRLPAELDNGGKVRGPQLP